MKEYINKIIKMAEINFNEGNKYKHLYRKSHFHFEDMFDNSLLESYNELNKKKKEIILSKIKFHYPNTPESEYFNYVFGMNHTSGNQSFYFIYTESIITHLVTFYPLKMEHKGSVFNCSFEYYPE